MARNQLESLLATAFPPELTYRDGDNNRFRRWAFPAFNATVSVFWSPFLVRGVEKSSASGLDHNELHLDSPDERWASELDRIDVSVFLVGHWFLHPAIYYDGDAVLGCHQCPGLNHTEIRFFDVFRRAFRTTLMDAEMRSVEVEAVAAAERGGGGLRIEPLDVTGLALMRPDGHPGPYMYPDPFAGGPKKRVQNDCVHWCLQRLRCPVQVRAAGAGIPPGDEPDVRPVEALQLPLEGARAPPAEGASRAAVPPSGRRRRLRWGGGRR